MTTQASPHLQTQVAGWRVAGLRVAVSRCGDFSWELPVIRGGRLSEAEMRTVGYQNWSDLAFVHWRVPVDVLRRVVPEPLSLDTWEDETWLGLVAFRMSGIRPWWSPALPYLSAFPETNLRTYVHLRGQQPGVWFFSLDASRWLAVQAARWGWGLNYQWSRMQVKKRSTAAMNSNGSPSIALLTGIAEPTEIEIAYRSHRWSGAPASVDMQVQVSPRSTPRIAKPGSLEFFLCERYVLYSLSRNGRLLTARVQHTPYPLLDARVKNCRQTLTETIGCRVGPADHVVFSPGVRVQITPLQRSAESD